MAVQHWILNDKNEVEPATMLQWAEYFQKKNRVLKQTYLPDPDREKAQFFVSTVFLGIDHGHGAMGSTPILFETMVFKMLTPEEMAAEEVKRKANPILVDFGLDTLPIGDREQSDQFDMVRYAEYEEAIRGHDWSVSVVQAHLDKETTLLPTPEGATKT